MAQVILGLALTAFSLQDDTLASRIEEILDSMRSGLAARARGMAELLELCRENQEARPYLRVRLRSEKDPRIRMRLRYVVGSYLADFLWKVKLEGEVHPHASAFNGRTYLQMSDGAVMAISAETGAVMWTGPKWPLWTASPILSEKYLWAFCEGRDGKSFLLQAPLSGARDAWRFPVDPEGAWPGDTMVVLRKDDGIRGRRADAPGTGWRARFVPPLKVARAGGHLMLWNGTPEIVALDVETTKRRWTRPFDWGVNFFEASQGILLARSARGRLRAFEAATGNIMWSHDLTDDAERQSPLWLTDRYILSIGSTTVCRDLRTGEKRWSAAVPLFQSKNPPLHAVIGNALVWAKGDHLEGFDLDRGAACSNQRIEFGGLKALVPGAGSNFYSLHAGGTVVAWRLVIPSVLDRYPGLDGCGAGNERDQ
ncbi:MAG: PQQ-like beta-propeller repeat protein [Planctomycetes bacterium]|nr:PQQ-like beta-propeller repeat protein [Planctomycetota bacterium]